MKYDIIKVRDKYFAQQTWQASTSTNISSQFNVCSQFCDTPEEAIKSFEKNVIKQRNKALKKIFKLNAQIAELQEIVDSLNSPQELI